MPLIIVSIIDDLPALPSPSLFPQFNRLTRRVISIFGDVLGASLLAEKSNGGGGGADPMSPQNMPKGGSPGSPPATHAAMLPSSGFPPGPASSSPASSSSSPPYENLLVAPARVSPSRRWL